MSNRVAAPFSSAPGGEHTILAFVDPRAEPVATLPDAEAVLLDPEGDGLRQILDILRILLVRDLEEVHLACVCDGTVAWLCGTSLSLRDESVETSLAALGRRVTPAGKIVLHGLESLKEHTRDRLLKALEGRLNRRASLALTPSSEP